MPSRFASIFHFAGLLATWIAVTTACNGLQATVDPGSTGGSTVKPVATGGSAKGGNTTGGTPASGGASSGGQVAPSSGGKTGGTGGGGSPATGGTTSSGGSGAGGSTVVDAGTKKDTAQVKDAPQPHDGEVGPLACDDYTSNSRLGVWSYVESAATTSQDVLLNLDVINFTALSAQLSQVTVRYWFTNEDPATPIEIAQYYVPPTAGVIKTKFIPLSPLRKNADTVLEISFVPNPDAGLSFVETTRFNLAFHKANYKGVFDLSNDYSFNPKLLKTFGGNPRITAYIKGVLSWGCEPEILPPDLDAGADASLD